MIYIGLFAGNTEKLQMPVNDFGVKKVYVQAAVLSVKYQQAVKRKATGKGCHQGYNVL